ncbi:MAG TPA: hydrogenase maturation protease [Candidatus Limnocylindria bacterium]|nr:hydrogenase maturation protease [Candidatus Limnocylindria bacterium]
MGSLLVIGYGNELRADDAAGYLLALRLADDPRLAHATVLARRQLTPELALDISRAGRVVLLDASSEVRAGEVAVRKLRPLPGGPLQGKAPAWSHHLLPEAVVGLAQELYGVAPPAHLVSLGVCSLAMEERLSAAVEAALPAAADAVVAIAQQEVAAELSRA